MILPDLIAVVRSSVALNSGAVPDEDEITWELPIPAAVEYRIQDGVLEMPDARSPWHERTVLLAMIEPLNMSEPLDRRWHAIRWRGDLYAMTGGPIVTRRRARDHHWTLELYRRIG